MANPYCDHLGIDVPDLGATSCHPAANHYSLLITALLERGGPMTLAEVAARFEAADLAPAEVALASLQRCKPARAPVYRDGDLYRLDLHSDELDLWTFRLGLRPARRAPLQVMPPVDPAPDGDQPLTQRELDEAFDKAYLQQWSDQRLALAVLDAGGEPMAPATVIAALDARHAAHLLRGEPRNFGRANSAVGVAEDGRWYIRDPQALPATRRAVRELLARARARAAASPGPEQLQLIEARFEARRRTTDAELATLRTAIVCMFPLRDPACVTILDARQRQIESFTAEDLDAARKRLATFDQIAAIEVHTTLRALGLDPEGRRLAELGPPQKTRKLNRAGRTLKITPALLISGSCGISRPLGDPARMREYLERGDTAKLRRRLEADAKALFAFHNYGLLHHCVRLVWGFLDEVLPAPWAPRDASSLHDLLRQAAASGRPLEVVAGSAPGWENPWARAMPCRVHRPAGSYHVRLVDPDGLDLDLRRVQSARLVGGT